MDSRSRWRSKVQPVDELFQLTAFAWGVSSGGYCLVKGREPGKAGFGTYLVEGLPESEIVGARVHDGLFREFADLPSETEPILSFAGKYGMLGAYVIVTPVNNESSPLKMSAGWRGESISIWRSEISTMYRLVRVWESIAGKIQTNQGDLNHWVHCLPEQVEYGWESPHDKGREIVASRAIRPGLFDILTKSQAKNLDEVLPWYLQITVNEGLKRSYSPARLLRGRQFDKLGLSVAPANLIGLLWLQFAKAIEGDTSYRRCDDCGKWFALGGRSGRSDKRFCSGTCKARTHRLKGQSPSK
jgi:hypothetical protein